MNLKNIHNVYFIGIGGIGMSALARYFNAMERMLLVMIKTQTEITNALEDLGIEIHFEDASFNIPEYLKRKIRWLFIHRQFQRIIKN